MPNWCENLLSITGNDDDMDKFMEVITLENGSFSLLEKLYPTPEELMIGDVSMEPDQQQIENQKILGYKSWYEWRIEKWGCKWAESRLYVKQDYQRHFEYSQIVFCFETPWGPPIEAFDKISGDWPRLLFCLYHEEPGMGFCGRDVWAKGKRQETEQGTLIQSHFDEEDLYEEYIREVI